MFESRRKANRMKRNANIVTAIFTMVAVMLLFVAVTTTLLFLYYVALIFFIMAVSISLGGGGTWSIGAEGEEMVAKHLSILGAPYRVIHDVVLPNMKGGNIDHIVLGPNGIFVIETKNNNGLIYCNGDLWTQRKIGQHGTPYFGYIGCPSKQVKRYAIFLKDFIRAKLAISVYVICIVVFTNQEAILRINNPTVIVLRSDELCDFIMKYHSDISFSNEELKKLDETIRPYSQFFDPQSFSQK